MRCFKCLGRKNIYKMRTGYTLENIGGILVKCPECQNPVKAVVIIEEKCAKIKKKSGAIKHGNS